MSSYIGSWVERLCYEPIAKLVSGDQLPHFGQFPSWNSLHGTTMQLIPSRKSTQNGIAAHPPRVLQLALLCLN